MTLVQILYSRAVNCDSRIQGHASPSPLQRTCETRQRLMPLLGLRVQGTCESKQGESTSPKSWTLSSSTLKCTFVFLSSDSDCKPNVFSFYPPVYNPIDISVALLKHYIVVVFAPLLVLVVVFLFSVLIWLAL